MTQKATPDVVVGPFDGRRLEWNSRAFVLDRRGDKFWVAEVEPGDNLPEVEVAPPERIVMTTGSRHQQIYWTSKDDGSLKQLPWVYEFAMARWIPSEHTFLRPDDWEQQEVIWNRDCVRCHSVGARPNFNATSTTWETEVTELGIACAGCHGPAEEHIRAHRNPLRRHSLRASDERDSSIVNPARLSKERSSEVCGQCHSFALFYPGTAADGTEVWGFYDDLWTEFRAGKEFGKHMKLSMGGDRQNLFWPDGSSRIGGREYNAMILSACYMNGEMTCLSCHTMHGDEPRDQLLPAMRGDEGCLQCHESFRDRIEEHTFHKGKSSGSRCYNCHMTHTAYALLGAVRIHRVDSPSASGRSTRDRPNACNLCHLDKTLAWTAEHLTDWYDAPPVDIDGDHNEVAASVVWVLRGDTAQRAITAWHMGQPWALEASGDDWQAPYLSRLLVDPYSATRLISHRSLQEVTGETIPFDYIGPVLERQEVSKAYLDRWVRDRLVDGKTGPPATLVEGPGRLRGNIVERLYKMRDNRVLLLSE